MKRRRLRLHRHARRGERAADTLKPFAAVDIEGHDWGAPWGRARIIRDGRGGPQGLWFAAEIGHFLWRGAYVVLLRGLVPVQRRKAREKALGSEKPTR